MYKRLMCGLAAAVLSCSAFADVTVYSGIDAGAGSGDPRPNSDAARADFVADIPAWALLQLDMEGLAPGPTAAASLGGGVEMTSVDQSLDCAPNQGIATADSAALGYNTTGGGSQYLGFCASEFGGTSSMTLSFDVPIQAFGAYFLGLGTVAAVVTLDFDDGSSQQLDLTGSETGGAAFYGFTDPGKFISSVVINEANGVGARDIFGLDDIIAVQVDDVARFHVTKWFSDGRTDEVDVNLTCTSGLPLSQDATIAGGDAIGVTFVIEELEGETVNCEVTESGGPDGYTAIMNDGDGCSWEGVGGWLYECTIWNVANPATFTVYKDWVVVNDGGDAVIGVAAVTATCDAEIVGGVENVITGNWSKSDLLGDGGSLVATVDTTLGSVTCWASESVLESGVESEDDCGARQIAAGGSSSCTFTNTVFFEGIPTLSQYGLAIMALLMLGVGFIGFRRFV